MIILVGSQKGGCGKSTMAINIASSLASMGKDVVIVDADRQSSCSDWIQYRSETVSTKIHCVAKYGNITSTLKDLATRYEYVVCDVAGRDSQELRSAMVGADLLLSPIRPSQPDINTIPHLAEVFQQAKDINSNLKGLVVLNMCPTHPLINEADLAESFLTEIAGLTLSETRIHDRKAYRDLFSDGLGAVEGKNPKARQEINKLTKEILQ